MPNTDLYDQFKALNISHDDIYNGYFHIAPTFANALIFLLSFYKPPRMVFDWCLERSLPFKQEQPQYPILYLVFRFFSLASRALSHLRHMDFPYLPGHAGAILHYTGFLWMWKKLFVPKFPLENLNNYKTKEIKEYGKERKSFQYLAPITIIFIASLYTIQHNKDLFSLKNSENALNSLAVLFSAIKIVVL